MAVPDATIATLCGIYDVMNGLALLACREGVPYRSPFRAEILGETGDPVRLASGVKLPVYRAAAEAVSDIVVVLSLLVPAAGWAPGRYPRIAD